MLPSWQHLPPSLSAAHLTLLPWCRREMASHPETVRGCTVLEIGAGCGACGILAAKLGASRVVLGDYVGAVLQNLRDCMHLNAAAHGGAAAAAGAGGAAADKAEWDPEDASECGSDDFDAFLAEATGRGGGGGGGGSGSGSRAAHGQQAAATAWDADAMHVRFHDW